MILFLKTYDLTKRHRFFPSNFKPIKGGILFFLFFSFITAFASEDALYSGQLSNGLTYYIHTDPTSKRYISLDFIVRVGSASEQEDERGFTHLIEHLIANEMRFKGVKISDDYCPIWDLSYPDVSELTSYEFTQYHMDVSLAIEDGLEERFKSFSSILTSLPVNHQSFVESKSEILEEISKTYNSPSQKWEQEKIGYEYPPYKNKHPLGELFKISRASTERVSSFFRKHYQPNNSAVIVIGNIDPNLAKQCIERYFVTQPSSNNIKHPIGTHTLSLGECVAYSDRELSQIELSLTKPLPRMSKQESHMFSMWTQLLQHHLNTTLLSTPLDFSNPQLEVLSYPKLLRLRVVLSQDNYQSGMVQLKDVLESFYKNPISLQDFTILKAHVRDVMLAQPLTVQYLSDFYRDRFIQDDSPSQKPLIDETIFDAISLENFHQAAKFFQGFSQASLATNQEFTADLSGQMCSLFVHSNHLRSSYDDR